MLTVTCAECHIVVPNAECRYAECLYAECRGAVMSYHIQQNDTQHNGRAVLC